MFLDLKFSLVLLCLDSFQLFFGLYSFLSLFFKLLGTGFLLGFLILPSLDGIITEGRYLFG
jgi:hypothetical protein